jgi:hypothetical protein
MAARSVTWASYSVRKALEDDEKERCFAWRFKAENAWDALIAFLETPRTADGLRRMGFPLFLVSLLLSLVKDATVERERRALALAARLPMRRII